MIIRKPYALLIKNFKRIHFVLALLMGYLALKSNDIYSFVVKYIDTGIYGQYTGNLGDNFINIPMFLIALIIILGLLVIYVLMRFKQKPTLLYLVMSIFYAVLIIYFFQTLSVFQTIESNLIAPRDIRLFRDIAMLFNVIQFAFVILVSIRALGFDIKKFNFGEDLEQLEINVSDNEEVELTVGVDTENIFQKYRRSRREIWYYIVENAFVLGIIFIIILIPVINNLFFAKIIQNRTISQTTPANIGYYQLSINDVYVTKLNQRGEVISKDKNYVIINFDIYNYASYPIKLDVENISLVGKDNKVYTPTFNLYNYFNDLGMGYDNQDINANQTKQYILVFEIDNNSDRLLLRYYEGSKTSGLKLTARYLHIKLDPIIINKISKVKEVNINEELSFIESNNNSLKINSFELNDQFTYDATLCYERKCSTVLSYLSLPYNITNKTILKLTYDYILSNDNKSMNIEDLKSLINYHGKLVYTYKDKDYKTTLVNKNPSDYYGNDLYYQIPNAAKEASKIKLVFTIRDKEYIYNLK